MYASVLSEYLPLAMELVSDVAINAAFPEDEVPPSRPPAPGEVAQA